MNNSLFANPQLFQAYQNDPGMAYGQALMQQGASTAPVRSPLEGLARALQAGVGGYTQSKVRDKYDAQNESYRKGLTAALQGGDVLSALQSSTDPQLQQLGMDAKLKQALEKPAKDGLVKIYDPQTKTERYIKESEAAGMQASGPEQIKIGTTRTYRRGGNEVTDQWDGQQWAPLGAGPAFAPQRDNPQFGMQPIWGLDKDGNPVVMQFAPGGGLALAQAPEGVTPSPKLTQMDLGTTKTMVNPITGKPEQAFDVDVQGKEAQQTQGTAQGTAKSNLPSATDAGNNAIAQIAAIKSDPDLGYATGWSGLLLNQLPSTKSKALALKIEQLKGGAFLQAFQTLKGAGAITEAEGAKATSALARLDLSQGEDDFKSALNDYESVIKQGIARLGNISQGNFAPGGPQGEGQAQSPPPKVYNYDSSGNLIP